MKKNFLIEIGTEELPPKSLPILASALETSICAGLDQAGIQYDDSTWLAAPRRLAVKIQQLDTAQPEQAIERRGPATNVGLDDNQNPTKALQGFARSCGVSVDELETLKTEKGEWFYYRATKPGQATSKLLPEIISRALNALPIPKPMRWGANDIEFIRPVHWLLMLLGGDVVPATLLGQSANRFSYGHRFMSPGKIELATADDYEQALLSNKVMVDFSQREKTILQQAEQLAQSVSGSAVITPKLLEEVAAIVEWPEPLLAEFDRDFLSVPQESLISAMQGHQKSFPVVDTDNKLMPYFIFVANICSKKPEQVIAGNQKVMHARLSDAAFFYHTDRKQRLDSYLPMLETVVFQKKLGNMADRSQRLSHLSQAFAACLGFDTELAKRAGQLAKCDLMTNMVFEFPELQGVMGQYYARNDGEHESICKAMSEHYLPTGAGDDLPSDSIALCVSLADKFDRLVGIFGIGQQPTGDKDPFGLRRAAIGIIRILLEKQIDVPTRFFIEQAQAAYGAVLEVSVTEAIEHYLFERVKYIYKQQGIDSSLFAAVIEVKPESMVDFDLRLTATKTFSLQSGAEALAEANKRVRNILQKQPVTDSAEFNPNLLQAPAEHTLFSELDQKQQIITPLLAAKDYSAVLLSLSKLQEPIAHFFNDVMVMVDNQAVRHNRLVLLKHLRQLFLSVADISQLWTT